MRVRQAGDVRSFARGTVMNDQFRRPTPRMSTDTTYAPKAHRSASPPHESPSNCLVLASEDALDDANAQPENIPFPGRAPHSTTVDLRPPPSVPRTSPHHIMETNPRRHRRRERAHGRRSHNVQKGKGRGRAGLACYNNTSTSEPADGRIRRIRGRARGRMLPYEPTTPSASLGARAVRSPSRAAGAEEGAERDGRLPRTRDGGGWDFLLYSFVSRSPRRGLGTADAVGGNNAVGYTEPGYGQDATVRDGGETGLYILRGKTPKSPAER
ncbi:hypothetical protein BC628DRAFT_1379794 [Trametes gibbosa]|nr:hypothetical protein BC628DRAFT_1379794 [Trametes gibbosa]